VSTALQVVVALFPVSEIVLAVVTRARLRGARNEDKGSFRLLWVSIGLAVTLAVVVAHVYPATRLAVPGRIIVPVALVLLRGGLAVRWTAILTLGRLFTVDVAIHTDHAVVQSGLYRYLRHPSYSGLYIAFLGLGVSFANWLSILVLLLPITFAILYRVAKEEAALLASLGPAYADYCARTKRFVPGLF